MSTLTDYGFERCAETPGDGGFDCGQCPFDNVCDLTYMSTAEVLFPPRLTQEEQAMDQETFRRNNRSLVYGPRVDNRDVKLNDEEIPF